MTSLSRVLALAAFEARLARRTIRGWILGALFFVIAAGTAGYYLALHRFFSGWSSAWAFITADLWVFQSAVTLGFLLGIGGVFFAFDWRHRDRATHFAPVLDASGLTRLEHAWGRFLGIASLAIFPIVLLAIVQVGLSIGFGVRVPASTYLLGHVLLALPMALVPTAIAFAMAALFHNQVIGRALAILLGLGFTVGTFVMAFRLPESVAVMAGAFTEVPLHSDFFGYSLSGVMILQRATAFGLLGLMVCLAAMGPLGAPHDARERGRRAVAVGGLFVIVAALVAATGWLYARNAADRQAQVTAEAPFAGRPEPTVTRREIEVIVEPGRSITGIATLDLRNDHGEAIDEVHVRLNRGLEIASVDGLGAQLRSRDQAMATIGVAPFAPGAMGRLTIRYAGRFDVEGVDPEAALDTAKDDAQFRNNRRFLGSVPAVFDRGAVTLGLDAGFYPEFGPRLGVAYPSRPAPALAPGTLRVRLPEGWLPASVGARSDEGAGSFLFDSIEPVPGFALCAARYDEATAEIAGIKVRVLYLPRHRRNVEFFASAKDEILARIASQLDEVRTKTGLTYPHPELTLVDVPQQLSTHFGWDAANRFGPPGLVLAREGAIFGARFEFALRQQRKKFERDAGKASSGGIKVNVSVGDDSASGMAENMAATGPTGRAAADLSEFDPAAAKVELLQRFVATDFTGGDVEKLALRSIWEHRVRPVGAGMPILAVALPQFVTETALGRASIESPQVVRILNGPAMGQIVEQTIKGQGDQVAETVVGGICDLDDVWTVMEETPLRAMDPRDKPREFVGVMYVKGRQPLLALAALIGREPLAAALASLAARPERDLSWEDFRSAVLAQAPPEAAADLQVIFDGWLEGTALPGFVASRQRTFRLPGETERWQVLIDVANQGTAPGTIRLQAGEGDGERTRLFSLDAGEAAEIGLVVPKEPKGYTLVPFLALNRRPPQGRFVKEEPAPATEAFEGERAATGSGPRTVTVDNLDDGFRLVVDGAEIAFGAPGDDGKGKKLGAWTGFRRPGKWKRWRSRGFWYKPFGVFDETAAVKAGKDEAESPAIWRTRLEPGTWRASVYLPSSKGAGRGPGLPKSYRFVVKGADGDKEVALDLDAPYPGWSDLGRFRFDGDAEVRLLDVGDGVIVADAIRFEEEAP